MTFDFQATFCRALPYKQFLQHYATPEQQDKWTRRHDQISLTAEQRALLGTFRRKMQVLCLAGAWCGDCVESCPVLERIAETCPHLIDLRFVNRVQRFDQTPVATVEEDDIRHKPIGKILVKWGILTPERVEKALLQQEEEKARGLNVRIGDVMTGMGLITAEQRDRALAYQTGFSKLEDADRQLAMELSICGAPRVPVVVFLSEDGYECARFGDRTLTRYRAKVAEGASCSTGLFAPPADLTQAVVQEWLDQFERVQWMLATSSRLMKLHGEI